MARPRVRPEAVLLLQPLRVGRDRRAARDPRPRPRGSIDAYAAAVGRWLVTRDGFDFLVYYLPDYDFASHALGPDASQEALARSDAAVGGADRRGRRAGRVPRALRRDRSAPTTARPASTQAVDRSQAASRRASTRRRRGRVEPRRRWSTGSTAAATTRASSRARLDGEPGASVVLFLEDGEAVARRDGEELRFAPRTALGDERRPAILDQPDALERAWAALANPNAGDVLVSAAEGVEFADLGGRAPRRRRQPRLARRRRLRGAVLDRRARRTARSDRGRRAARARALRRRAARLRAACRCGLTPRERARAMVERQLRRRDIADERVLARDGARPARALRPGRARARRAYDDAALPIGRGPDDLAAVHGRPICEALAVSRGDELVLDVGTGSGYQAAVLAELGAEVRHDRADPRAGGAGAREPRRGRLRAGRGRRRRRRRSACPGARPFDAIAVAAAAPEPAADALRAAAPGRPARRAGRRPAAASGSR